MINHLNEINDVKIYSIYDDEFKTYGRIVEGYDFSEAIAYMEKNNIPLEKRLTLTSGAKWSGHYLSGFASGTTFTISR